VMGKPDWPVRPVIAEAVKDAAENPGRDLTVTADPDTVIIALVRRLGGRSATFTADELARAKQLTLDLRSDGHTLQLRVFDDT